MTVEAFYRDWIEEQPSRVRPHRVKEYESHFQNHILPARIGSGTFGKLPLSAVTNVHLSSLQDRLREKGLKANMSTVWSIPACEPFFEMPGPSALSRAIFMTERF